MMRTIDDVGLTVADLDRAVEFWCGRLGLRLVSRVTETGSDIASLIGEDSVERSQTWTLATGGSSS
jgi:catechol 2,3-dioxygenase-like lactoylglutathione lyase family enzyme